VQLAYAEEMGLGSRRYELVKLEPQRSKKDGA